MTMTYRTVRDGDGYDLYVCEDDGDHLIAQCPSGKHAQEAAWTWATLRAHGPSTT